MPLWSCSSRWTAARAAARPARGRDLRRDHRRRRCRPAPACPPRACSPRRCSVSRGVVSEAYAQIAAEGWIEVRHGSAPGRPRGRRRRPRRRARRRSPTGVDRRGSTSPRPRRISPRSRGARGRRRCGACWPSARRGARLRRPARRRGAAARAGRVPGAGARARRRPSSWSPAGYTQGAVADVPGAGGARRDAVAVEDPSLDDSWATIRSAGPGGGRACRSTSTGRAGRARRRRHARHARAPVPDRRGARARAPARAARVGRDRDRGRLRLRVPLRPRAGRHAAAARAGPRRLPRHGVEDARAGAAARLGCSRRRTSPQAIAARALGGRLRRPGDHRARLRAPDRHRRARPPPAPHPPRVPRAPRPAGRGARRSGSRTAGSRASPPACTCCCGSRPAPTRRRSSPRSPSAGSASAAWPSYRARRTARDARAGDRLRPAADAPRSTRGRRRSARRS